MVLALLAVTSLSLAGDPPARPAFYDTICVACHTVDGGASVGPDLAGVGVRRTSADLDKWLKDPPAYKPGTAMPKIDMTDEQRAELVKWLSSLK